RRERPHRVPVRDPGAGAGSLRHGLGSVHVRGALVRGPRRLRRIGTDLPHLAAGQLHGGLHAHLPERERLSDLLSKVRQEVGNTGPDLTKPQTGGGGGDYVPPAEGATRLRLTGYVETGIHTKRQGGQSKTKPRVELMFEL